MINRVGKNIMSKCLPVPRVMVLVVAAFGLWYWS